MIKKYAINIFIPAVTFITIFFIVEIFLRFYFPQLTLERAEELSPKVFENSAYTPWKLKPNSSGRITSPYGEYDVPVKINSHGLRDYDFSPIKAKNTRIIVIGDSFTYGVGVSLEDTYPKKLEYLLNLEKSDKSYNYHVINAGFADGGEATDVQYLYLKEKGLNFSPDVIILGFFVKNDITDLDRNVWLEKDLKGLPKKIISTYYFIDDNNRLRRNYENQSYYKKYRMLGNANHFLSKKSHFYVLIKNSFIRATNPPPEVFFEALPVHLEDNFEKVKFLLNESNKLAGKNSIKFVIVVIPSKIQVVDRDWKDYREFYKNMPTSRYMPQKIIMDFCAKNEIECIDLLPEFLNKDNKNDLYYKIDGHWNEKGHELASNLIYERLKNEI